MSLFASVALYKSLPTLQMHPLGSKLEHVWWFVEVYFSQVYFREDIVVSQKWKLVLVYFSKVCLCIFVCVVSQLCKCTHGLGLEVGTRVKIQFTRLADSTMGSTQATNCFCALFAHFCTLLQMFAQFCTLLQTFAHSCKRLYTFAHFCKHLHTLASFCKYFASYMLSRALLLCCGWMILAAFNRQCSQTWPDPVMKGKVGWLGEWGEGGGVT